MAQKRYILCASFGMLILLTCSAGFAQKKSTFGWLERVRMLPEDFIFHAKLDTGADYSSVHAEHLKEFTRKNQDWVRFSITNRYGKRKRIEKPISRHTSIKRSSSKNQERPVVRLGICLGEEYMEEEVSLVDRRKFDYQMLIGRSFLAGKAIIDPSISYTTEPDCKMVKKDAKSVGSKSAKQD